VPPFPPQMEQRITNYLQGDGEPVVVNVARPLVAPGALRPRPLLAESEWLLNHATVVRAIREQ